MRSRCMHVSKDCRVGCPGRTIISGGREGADVGEAREVMDRVTDAILRGDLEALKGLYAQDAVAETPDQGTITGRDHIAAYLAEFGTAFPDAAWEERSKHEGGDTAIDEGTFVGTNTGSITGPNGETIPATGRGVCAFASATSRRSRMGLSRATVSTSTCRTGPRSSVSRPSPGRSPRRGGRCPRG